jgi:hypothetical protein
MARGRSCGRGRQGYPKSPGSFDSPENELQAAQIHLLSKRQYFNCITFNLKTLLRVNGNYQEAS